MCCVGQSGSSISVSEKNVSNLIAKGLAVQCHNGPRQCCLNPSEPHLLYMQSQLSTAQAYVTTSYGTRQEMLICTHFYMSTNIMATNRDKGKA